MQIQFHKAVNMLSPILKQMKFDKWFHILKQIHKNIVYQHDLNSNIKLV